MKKIAIVNSIYPFGSTGRICQEMQHYFAEHSFDVLCFHGEGTKTNQGNYNFSFKLSKHINAFLSRLDDGAGLHSTIETRKLIKKLNDFKPDLLIVHNLHAYYINIIIFLTYISQNNLPVIFVLHDCWNFTGHCAHFDLIGCEKWKTNCFKCPQLSSYPTSWFADKTERNYSVKKKLFSGIKNKVFVTPSFWLSDLVKHSFLCDSPIYTINNGIDTNVFCKRNISRLSDIFTILCVANVWDEKKGILDVLKLSTLLDDNYQIIIVGKIKGRTILNNNIKHIERTNDVNELAVLYSGANVFFNPTYEDNYPTVNLEALSCGCPVVCYKTGGAFEMLNPKYVVEKGDYLEAFERIKEIVITNDYVFPETSKFDKKLQYDKYLTIVEEMLKK